VADATPAMLIVILVEIGLNFFLFVVERQPCPQNVRLGRKGFPGTNTLAYLASLSVKKMLIFEG
jgi:hypothetical protein